MEAPAPRLRLAVDEKVRDWIQLIPVIEADGADRRLISETCPDGVAPIAQIKAGRSGPQVAAIEKAHAAEVAGQHGPQFLAEPQHAVAADRFARYKRADFVASPSADARGTAEKIFLPERDVGRVVVSRPDV